MNSEVRWVESAPCLPEEFASKRHSGLQAGSCVSDAKWPGRNCGRQAPAGVDTLTQFVLQGLG